jgi:deoxycytidylate deaminase
MANYLHIEQARLQAKKSNIDMATGYGCVLVYNGKIVSEGHNQRKGVRTNTINQYPLCS